MQMQDVNVTRPTTTIEPNLEEELAHADRRPNGEAMATLVAAGIGAFLLGFFTTMAEVSQPLKDFLTFDKGVGPLSGKTIIPVVLWLVSWVVLFVLWKDKTVDFGKAMIATFVLVGLGFLGTFPIFFQIF
jgi:hypothetical protein